jgi:hypothetical protein
MNYLKNKYVIGTHVMFYEIELVKYYIKGLINAVETVENKENIYIDFVFNVSEFFEKIDNSKITKESLIEKFESEIESFKSTVGDKINLSVDIKDNDSVAYTQTNYRRELNTKYCYLTDYIIWGETDSHPPRECFHALETLKLHTNENNLYRYLVSFADRKMWDDSWNPTVHPKYENLAYIEDEATTNENFAKSPMSIERMNEINSEYENYDIQYITYPKIDGSFLVMTSDLIKSGVNIPPCFIHNDDEALSMSSKLICGNQFIQFIFKNILKVHARRHPEKRLYVLDENNPKGLTGDFDKGDWWIRFKKMSQFNINNLFNSQVRFKTYQDLLNDLNKD